MNEPSVGEFWGVQLPLTTRQLEGSMTKPTYLGTVVHDRYFTFHEAISAKSG